MAMQTLQAHTEHTSDRRSGYRPALAAMAIGLLCLGLTGCAAMTNPVAHGISVCQVPMDMLAERKQGKQTIPLNYLSQTPPAKYLLGPGDVLGVYIEGILGEKDKPPPVNVSEGYDLPPSIGYPIPIRDDGAVPLPLVPPIPVAGMTLSDAEKAIINAYTVKAKILQTGQERIIVTLINPRETRVLVIRQDAAASGLGTNFAIKGTPIQRTKGLAGGAEQLVGGLRRGGGMLVSLPAYENDVLHALAQTGGLPGLDAQNEIIIQRADAKRNDPNAQRLARGLAPMPPSRSGNTEQSRNIIRIPLRLAPGQTPPFKPEDIILHSGDIVFIEARETEVFYTAGLLPTGEWPLPRDYDLDVVKAVAQIGGPMVNGGLNTSNLNGTLIAPGLGGPSPRLVSVLRRDSRGCQVTITVDLSCALQDPSQSLLLKPGDVLILQEAKKQAFVRYLTQQFQFNVISRVINTSTTQGTVSATGP